MFKLSIKVAMFRHESRRNQVYARNIIYLESSSSLLLFSHMINYSLLPLFRCSISAFSIILSGDRAKLVTWLID